MWFTRYNILVILCLPILLLFLLRIYDNYKRKKVSLRGYIILLIFWLILLIGICFNRLLFSLLDKSHLTNSTPLSLYDVVQITAIIFLLYIVFRQTFKLEELRDKVSKLNQELSLKLTKNDDIKD